ncbi:mRNA cleavage and polyadenylation factor subunit [Recurvomyces mirabilis]|uniref:mRNA cleavage and polyadenylation factor subunit n=1 Tax=Recurvomyces mirabilis TaxID=574656 RepID=A0AAE1C2J7_9PEZI|nr:mRNA cleavage and polyadenylation factor subunit [Recurvomyces mirabilis]KAK5155934.1 mRNA cleavage and polyadenylation factor subunit [Recurvomyces mirabilis]
MQCYTELLPPTAVTHAVSLPFLSANSNNLIVAKTSLLQVFEVRDAHNTSNGNATQSKLSLIGEYPLSGTVTSLRSIALSTTASGGHALLVGLKDAKISLVEWDPENHRISTISIHYYEGDNVSLPPFGPSLKDCESSLTVDPSSRCAALRFGQRHLAILPFRQHGDDLAEEEREDGFDADMGDAAADGLKRTTTNGIEINGDAKLTPYKASFVTPLTTLDPSLTHPVDLAFLHEYREPTFGILSASQQPSQALLDQRKDCLSYQVFTLDLEQRASTNLISVPKLPSDLWKVVPLALPVGGALLVGTNEFVHIDQNGKANAVAVNEFAKRASGFAMTDQSDLQLKLEDCELETLDTKNGDLLIVLHDGSLAVLNFRLTGRNIGGLLVTRVSSARGGSVNASAPSCLVSLDGQKLFIGSEDGNSSLLSWDKDAPSTSRKRSHAQMLDQQTSAPAPEDADEAEEVDEDDLYAPTAEAVKRTVAVSSQTAADSAAAYRFELHDELQSLGPINDTCLGRSPDAAPDKLELVAAVGRGKASRLAFMHRDILPTKVRSRDELLGARNIWSVRAHSKDSATEADEHDTHLFVSDPTSTRVYTYAPDGDLKELTDTDFDSEGPTLAVAALAHGTMFLQCRATEIRTYDRELGLSQIIPLIDDEDDGGEAQDLLTPVAVDVCDPYVLVLREGGGVVVLKAEEKQGEVEMLDIPAQVEEKTWIGGCLYSGPLTADTPTMWLLDGETMALHVFALPSFERVMVAAGLPFLPPVLTPDAPLRRGAKATLTEILVADLGNEGVSRPFLVLRTAMDELVFYEPFYYDSEAAAVVEEGKQAGFGNLRFRKVPNTYVPTYDDEAEADEDGDVATRPQSLRAMCVGGRHVVYVPGGRSPSFIIKDPGSLPKVLGLRLPPEVKALQTLAPLSAPGCEQGFALVERGGNGVQECLFPARATFETGWSVEKMAVTDGASQEPREVRRVGYHEGRGLYVVASCRDVDWIEGGGQEEEVEDGEVGRVVDDISLRPQLPHYTLHLLSSRNHATIQTLGLPYLDTLTALKILPIEISERTHEQRSLIVATTASIRGQDTPALGAVTVFDLIDVVPDPDIEESGVQMHLLSREETKGAVTALEGLGGGFIGTAQGMKLMVRGLKEDGSCLPVAFLDAQQSFVTTLKCLGSSGLWLAGDAKKGVWIGGWTQEPYRLSILGRGGSGVEVLDADFLPMGGALGVIVADGDGALHCLQYDPEDPATGHGQRLLDRAAFDTGHVVTLAGMMLLPSTLSPFAEQAEDLAAARPLTNGNADGTNGEAKPPSQPQHHRLNHVLLPTLSGSIGLLTPITDEATYRRLSALQTQLTNLLEHAAGLNPRAYRAVDTLATPAVGSRGVLDGSLVQRISELGATRRAEVLGRAGTDSWALRSDLEVISGGGLGYL